MIIKLLKQWGMSAPGDVLPNVAKPVADLLIQREIGVEVKPKKKAKRKASKCLNTK